MNSQIYSCVKNLWEDEIVCYIRSVYNYGKHTLALYGSSSFADLISGQRDICIPVLSFVAIFISQKEQVNSLGIMKILSAYILM